MAHPQVSLLGTAPEPGLRAAGQPRAGTLHTRRHDAGRGPHGSPGLTTNSQPRVLQVVLSLAPGGTERLVIEIARRLQPGITAAVCCLDEPGQWAPELAASGIDLVALHRQPGFRPVMGVRIAAVAARYGATVLHCHQYSPFVYGCLAAMLRPGLRLVYTEHGRLRDAPSSARRRFANRLIGHRPDVITTVSAELRSRLVADRFPADRIQIVHNGIDPGPERGPADRLSARRTLGIAAHVPLIGTVARLDPIKRLDVLVAAFALMKAAEPDARLVIIGDGPERRSLEAHAARQGAAERVLFLGHHSDARDLMAALDVYVNSSATEGISLAILEAMAASVPVVATNVGGNPEIVVAGQTGLLVPPHEPASLAAAMRELMASPNRRRAFGTWGRQRVIERFSLDRMIAHYVAAYCPDPVS